MGKKEKGFRKELIMPLFIVVIMVMSVFGYMWGSSRTRLNYNGFKFYQLEEGNFMVDIGNNRIIFNYFPTEIQWINTSKGIGNILSSPMIYVTYGTNSSYAETIAEVQFSIGQLLGDIKGTYVQNAFTSETEFGLPIITCKNATPAIPVINIEKANTTEIILEDNCVVVKAKSRQEMFMAYERLLYSVLGVME